MRSGTGACQEVVRCYLGSVSVESRVVASLGSIQSTDPTQQSSSLPYRSLPKRGSGQKEKRLDMLQTTPKRCLFPAPPILGDAGRAGHSPLATAGRAQPREPYLGTPGVQTEHSEP